MVYSHCPSQSSPLKRFRPLHYALSYITMQQLTSSGAFLSVPRYIHDALILLRLILRRSLHSRSRGLLLTQLLCATFGHTLLHTGRPTKSSVISRLITSCPTQIGSRHIAAGSITILILLILLILCAYSTNSY
jgi:hypothetical protein